jgi:trehalose 6-phosphate synthase/phosphatase
VNKQKNKPGKIVVVSNRLPVTVAKKRNHLVFQQSQGGLATGLRSLQADKKAFFIGWPGYNPVNKEEREKITRRLREEFNCYPVYLTQHEINKYYYGFSNRTLWPLFHYFSSYSTFDESEWTIYKKVNQKFSQAVLDAAEENDTFWVHDYHLMLLPQLIRIILPESAIGFFLHIPFPSSEIFRILPWRTDILEGLMGADLLGFHTYEYARHFLSSVLRLLGYEHEFGSISIDGRIVRVDNFPMGIDVENNTKLLSEPGIKKEISQCRHRLDAKNKKIILSVDRLDYTKGIPQRLAGFETFLSQNKAWHNKITYLMLCVPSRTRVEQYAILKEEVDRLVGRINGRFGGPGWQPVHYMYRSLPFNKLLPLYAAADIALVTPIRDGMNLVAKEYVAAKADNNGVLILSGTAGASDELGEALTVNVHSKNEIANAITQALRMPEKERAQRIKNMRKRIVEYDIQRWTESFVSSIEESTEIRKQLEYRKLTRTWRDKLLTDYKTSRHRLLLLDYDGTLISFAKRPEEAKPDTELKRLLLTLAKDDKNHLAIVSGRDRKSLQQWLGSLPASLIAEHGAWVKSKSSGEWKSFDSESDDWKNRVRPILKNYEFRVPGSFVEEKEFGLAWHYRKANPDLGEIRSCELFDNLNEFLANTSLQLIHGKKVIEVRVGGVNKGIASMSFLEKNNWDFILALGDDWTDEDLFKILPKSAYSIKIGYGPTQAKFYLESPQSARMLLRDLSKA